VLYEHIILMNLESRTLKMQIVIQQTFRLRKCISGSSKLADPENNYLDPKQLQIPKMKSHLQKTCKSRNEDLDTENL
jgi:hypothetical protein